MYKKNDIKYAICTIQDLKKFAKNYIICKAKIVAVCTKNYLNQFKDVNYYQNHKDLVFCSLHAARRTHKYSLL